jgi:sec-independent protein translocase protein TatA
MPFGVHPGFLIILLIIVLIIFGPGKLPELGGAAGRAIKEFRKTSNEITEELSSAVGEKEQKTQATASTTPPDSASTTSQSEKSA